jgi:hypothetical protein
MSDLGESAAQRNHPASAAIIVLLVLTGVMLLALFSRTVPYPPLEVPPFALGPFLGASLAIGAAAFHLVRQGARYGSTLAILFAVTALVSFGPQKYFDPIFSRVWPAVITAHIAVIVIVAWCIVTFRKREPTS